MVLKAGLTAFGNLHTHLRGVKTEKEADTLYNEVSLSLRVLLYHYRKCKEYLSVWTTCRKVFKGPNSHLQAISNLLDKIELEPETVANGSGPEWRATSTAAGTLPFFEVCRNTELHPNPH